jgi:hypothetical protein
VGTKFSTGGVDSGGKRDNPISASKCTYSTSNIERALREDNLRNRKKDVYLQFNIPCHEEDHLSQ